MVWEVLNELRIDLYDAFRILPEPAGNVKYIRSWKGSMVLKLAKKFPQKSAVFWFENFC